ncbi:DUF2502 domain-containing protein [Azonexus hydrophilus]|jgi:hypothetical protein|nr:DUF2502 domain-containing protein [Rhodocyclaceae bacterium]
MKKILCTILIACSPVLSSASELRVDIGSVRVQSGDVTVTFGSRNDRGHYWDGYEWRAPAYWKKHHGPRGEKYYTGRPQGRPHQGSGFCPPGQAKKGNC